MSKYTNRSDTNAFFVVGGTLGREATSYVRRPVDEEILRLTLAGEYCNVLAARQTGKSSLMVRTSERLKREGVRPVIIDLTSIGSAVSPSEWYFGLLSRLSRELDLGIDEQAWWQARSEKSPIQRFSDFLREVVLEEIPEKIVIFVDEIDSTLKLDFTDDFFAAIRAAYNARSRDRAFDRLTFVGVANAPSANPSAAASEKFVAEHCEIIDALQARDRSKVTSLINKHISKSQKRLFAVLENPPIVE